MRGVDTRKSEVQPVKAARRVEGESKSAWRMVMDWSRRCWSLGDAGSDEVWRGSISVCARWK
jgi:hypothetical protein